MPIVDRWRPSFSGNERIDLPDFIDLRDQIIKDFNFLVQAFVDSSGSGRVLRRYEQGTHSGLTFKIKKDINRAAINGAQDFVWANAGSSGTTFDLSLSPSTTNYVQMKIKKNLGDLQTRAFWDTDIGLTGEEFFDIINTKELIEEEVTSNTVGFDSDAVPLFTVVTAPSSISTVTDSQDHFFKPRSVSLPAATARTSIHDNVKDVRLFIDYLYAYIKEMKGTSQVEQSTPWSSLKLLREYQNLFFTGGGSISFENPTANTVVWTSAIDIEIAGRSLPYVIDPGSVALLDGECAYVDVPEGAPSGSLTPTIAPFASVPIDPVVSGSSPRIIILFFRRSTTIYSTMDLPELDSGESAHIGWDLPLNIRTRLGISSESSYVAYPSVINILANDDYATAIGKLDASLGAVLSSVSQEDTQTVGIGGVTTFTSSSMVWNASNTSVDIKVYINGKKVQQDLAGGLTQGYRKTSTTTLQFSETVPAGAVITVRLEGTSGGGGGGGSITTKLSGSTIVASTTALNFGSGFTVADGGSGQANIGLTGSSAPITKSYKNMTGITIPAGSAVAFADNGSIVLADANVITLSDFCGITQSSIANGAYGAVYKLGNCPGVISSLGATPGQDVYLGETPGTLQLTAPGNVGDSVLTIGRAEPPDGIQQSAADDLYLLPRLVAVL